MGPTPGLDKVSLICSKRWPKITSFYHIRSHFEHIISVEFPLFNCLIDCLFSWYLIGSSIKTNILITNQMWDIYSIHEPLIQRKHVLFYTDDLAWFRLLRQTCSYGMIKTLFWSTRFQRFYSRNDIHLFYFNFVVLIF